MSGIEDSRACSWLIRPGCGNHPLTLQPPCGSRPAVRCFGRGKKSAGFLDRLHPEDEGAEAIACLRVATSGNWERKKVSRA